MQQNIHDSYKYIKRRVDPALLKRCRSQRMYVVWILMFCQFAPIRQIYASKDMRMTIQTRVSQERRNTSRVIARLDCHFTIDGVSHKGVIVDLSLRGAYLSAKHLPPNGSDITVKIQPPAVKRDLVFDGKVIRGTWAMSEQGKLGRFGVRFSSPPPDLIPVISKLHS